MLSTKCIPGPVAVICKILVFPGGRTRLPRLDSRFQRRARFAPCDNRGGQARARKRVDSAAALTQYMSDWSTVTRKNRRRSAGQLVNDSDGPDGRDVTERGCRQRDTLPVAGHDSTVNTISNCVMTFVRNPGTWSGCVTSRS
jgi:cytochrome P450